MSDTIDDWQLVAQARAGDLPAFETLVRRYQGPVVHFCARMLGSIEDAEDVAQESFVRLHRHLGRLKPKAKFSTVIFGIARNLTLNYIRDGKRRGRGKTHTLTRDNETESLVADSTWQPDHTARMREIGALIEKALERVSPEHREMIVLREIQGLDYDTIAAITQCRNGTVKSRLARAREQLRLKLIELGGDFL